MARGGIYKNKNAFRANLYIFSFCGHLITRYIHLSSGKQASPGAEKRRKSTGGNAGAGMLFPVRS